MKQEEVKLEVNIGDDDLKDLKFLIESMVRNEKTIKDLRLC